ncbi:hypothetical protein NEIMUCOT_05196 [Neisseria mucosa ATCC 25996]|uniref:Uncharacterized protein n=1 Tax=Neisseria mucosa (strain ATCC 25996 / DSM 4631 / NCTC 10774 / M26) TaxID=546266 RepID=D2ZX47_NEIM2|nr:hypothetical protein NEIMUCOT_05196 [Neisseria mucosa ATCC 25996]
MGLSNNSTILLGLITQYTDTCRHSRLRGNDGFLCTVLTII